MDVYKGQEMDNEKRLTLQREEKYRAGLITEIGIGFLGQWKPKHVQ